MPDMYIPYDPPYCDETEGCATGGGSNLVPAGGTTGQVLAKLSNADYDDGWVTPTGGGGGGAEFIVASSAYSPADWVAKAAYVTDGTADDVEIQQALTDAGTIGPGGVGGGTVLLAPGLYFITTDLTVPAGVGIEGGTINRFFVQIALNNSKIIADPGAGGLKNLSIIGFSALPTGFLVDYGAFGVSSQIDNVQFTTAGVTTDTSLGQFWADFNMDDDGYVRRLKLDGEADFPIGASQAEALIRISGSRGAIEEIQDEVSNAGNVSGSNEPFFTLAISTGFSSIRGINISNGASISIGGQNADISNVNVNFPNGYGIRFQGSDSIIHECTVVGAGQFLAATYDGILIDGTTNNQVHHNSVYQSTNALYGLHIGAGATDTTVTDNFLVGGASGAEFQDDGTTTRTADNFVV